VSDRLCAVEAFVNVLIYMAAFAVAQVIVLCEGFF
jgi:hypothetical protein